MTISEEKKQLRHQIRARERKLAPDYRVSSDQVIAANILDFPIYQSAWTVFCFVSTSEEINTRPILLNALETGKRLCVPRCAAAGEWTWWSLSLWRIWSWGPSTCWSPGRDCPLFKLMRWILPYSPA